MVQSGQVPSLGSHETPFHWDYVSIDMFELLETIDIVGFTALQHASTIQTINELPKCDPRQPMYAATCAKLPSKMTSLLRTLIKQNQYCEVSTFLAFPTNNIDFIDILFEHGASLDISETDGLTPRNTFIRHGPRVTPCLTKWISKRRERCDCFGCGKPRGEKDEKSTLLIWSHCQVERHCSVQCQNTTWAQHKKVCKPFDTSTTIVLIPNDYEIGSLQSMANFARSVFGSDQHLPTPKNTNRDAGVPRTKPRKPNIKNSIVKVQIAMGPTTTYDVIFDSNSFDPHGNLLIYTKNRDLVYTIHIKEQIGGVSAPGVG
ncbi:hypothetical protein C8J55DRAFT_521253 [Lentinula edodes]|uniref:MYND-type domain-containing protein n=1 Tax=Lentinula lateritia TaxID=40482 RepID=A0A9W9DHQ4_9AGAR|nr:hypothetical protein C8J55DRAFT_521253 [Lentinula edodes]